MNKIIIAAKKPAATRSGRALEDIWIRVDAGNTAEITRIAAQYKVEFPATPESVYEDHDSVCLAVTQMVPTGQEFRLETIVIAMSETIVVTLEPGGQFTPFDKALSRFRRHPDLT
jgi:magnesium transporter